MAVEGTGNGRKDPRPRSILSPAAQDPIGTREREREEEEKFRQHPQQQGCRNQDLD